MSDQNPPTWGEPPTPPPGPEHGIAPLAGLGYASWGQRVGAFLVDILTMLPFFVVMFIGIAIGAGGASTDPVTGQTTGINAGGFVIATVAYLAALVFQLWNTVFRQGRTGWSIGKQVLGIRLVREQDGEPMGAGLSFVRQVVHVVDGIPCYVGYLWPLWDAKRQTFADKIMGTVVIQQKKG